MSKTRFYEIWVGMKKRCDSEKSKAYKWYGARGITYQPSWASFESFRDDMYESYQRHVEKFGEKQTTIDRIDVNGNYTKENCRWATREEQDNNRRDSRYVGDTGLTVAQFAKKHNINYQTLMGRLKRGKNPIDNT